MARHGARRAWTWAVQGACLCATVAAGALAPGSHVVLAAEGQRPDPAYAAAVERWRNTRDAQLSSAEGWLTVVGLAWLKEGTNTVGRDAGNAIRLDAASAPTRIGAFDFHDGVVTFDPVEGQGVQINGKPAARQVLRYDSRPPDRVQAGSVTMFIIKRGTRYGVRIRDAASPARREFTGTRWYPIRPDLAITARFVAHPRPTTIPIANVLGDVDEQPTPGYVVFTIGGKEYRLHPIVETSPPRQLFFIFRDRTSGSETYGGGRFLYTEMPKDGKVVLDFNKAENPPCAYTAFATCPLPPKQNALPIRIEAGELTTHHDAPQPAAAPRR